VVAEVAEVEAMVVVEGVAVEEAAEAVADAAGATEDLAPLAAILVARLTLARHLRPTPTRPAAALRRRVSARSILTRNSARPALE
jgi:hypothetical protein